MRIAYFSSAILVASLGMSACGPKQVDRVQISYVDAHESEVARAFTDEGLLKESFSVHRTDKEDSWYYSLPLDEDGAVIAHDALAEYRPGDILKKRPVRRELDLNGDGTVDLIRTYDDDGKLKTDTIDTDFDGQFDRVLYYRDGLVSRREIDADQDGQFEEVRQYIKGELFRVERDTTGDGSPDFWMFFKDGALERAGIDVDGDGVVDEWLISKELRRVEREIQRSEEEEDAKSPSSI